MSPPAPPPPPSESITTTSPSLPPRKDIFADCSSNDEDDGDFQEWHQATTPSPSPTSTHLNNLSLKEDSIMSLLIKASSSSISSTSTKVKKERENQKCKERQTQKDENIRRLRERSEELQKKAKAEIEQLRTDFLNSCSAEIENESNQEDENDGDDKKQCPSYYASVPSGAEEPLSRKDVDWISMNAWITDNNAKISPKNQDSSEASDRLFSLFKRMANEQKKRNKLNGAFFK